MARCGQLISLLMGLSLFGGSIAPASANEFGGPRATDSNFIVPGGSTGGEPNFGGLTSTQVISSGTNFSQSLSEALDACIQSAAPETSPRRFARGQGNSEAECISPECVRLNSLFEEANTFLNQVETGSSAPATQIW